MSRFAPRLPVSAADEFPHHLIRLFMVLLVLLAGMPRVVFGFGPVTIVTGSSDTNSDDKKQAVATCPPGTIAFSGGAWSSTFGSFTGEIAVVYSAPTGDPPSEWVVMAQEMVPTDENWIVYAYAHCADIPGYKKVSAGSPITSDNYKAIDVSCPQGTTMIGGGGAVISTPDIRVLLTENRPEGNGWSAAAVEYSPTASSWLMGAVASCAPASDLEVISANLGPNPGNGQSVDLFCAPNRFAVGGGWKFFGAIGTQGLRTSRRSASHYGSWEIYAEGLSPGSELDLTAYALCLSSEIFSDGFELGITAAWSSTIP